LRKRRVGLVGGMDEGSEMLGGCRER